MVVSMSVSTPLGAMSVPVTLVTNYTVIRRLVRVSYSKDSPVFLSLTFSISDACGGVLGTPNGTILSPSFPKEYPMNKECIWEIIAPEQYKITLNFTHFDLEGHDYQISECEYDSVKVYSKMNDDNLRLHGTYCGFKIPPLLTSDGNAFRIEFKSDKNIQKTGFSAFYVIGGNLIQLFFLSLLY